MVMIILGLSIYNNSIIIEENYDSTNGEEVRYIQEQYKRRKYDFISDYFMQVIFCTDENIIGIYIT
ncbi:MAG: hypothetical protein ACLR6T_03520 [Intestinibacter sp.]